MKNGKRCLYLVLVLAGCILTGCAKEQTISENGISVAEEIAEGVSENVIPQEAKVMVRLTFDVPSRFRPAQGNTELKQAYVSENPNDNSYISYIRQDRDVEVDYSVLTKEDYQKALESQLQTQVQMQSSETRTIEGYEELTLQFTYTLDEVKYHVTECIFFTEKYIFTIVYAMDNNASWSRDFQNSRNSIVLENTIHQMEGSGISMSLNTVQE